MSLIHGQIKPQADLLWCRAPPAAPREPGTISAAIGEGPPALPAPPPQATSKEEGRESTAKEREAETGTNREFEMLERRGGSIRLPSPSRAFLYCPGPAGTAPPSHHPCHGHIHPAAPTPLPPPWQYAPKPSRTLSYLTSF